MRGWHAIVLILLASPLAAQQAVKSPHGTLPDGLDCSACHTAEGWHTLRTSLGFDHAKTGFPLSGAHRGTACAQCHLDLHFDEPKIRLNDCAACHMDVHQGKMLQSCSACHTTRSFRDVNGELIHARTSFPLTGAHRQITCESCHKSDVGGRFTPLPTDCASCHMADYRRAKSVDHVANGYPTDCTQCHTTVDWHDAPSFDHAKVSGGFQLLGAHAGLRCASCHRVPGMEPLFKPASQNDCVACHQTDYDKAHSGSGFPTTCASCHNMNQWGDANFDHSTTGFPLVGAHTSLSCSKCHSTSNDLSKLPTGPNDCVACHQADYDKAHSGSGFPTTCTSCHNTSTWGDANFDHASTGFTLVGAHASLSCSTCHSASNDLSKATSDPNDCVACHQPDYDKAHGSQGFPTDCKTCHTATAWTPSTFDHDAQYFPIFSGRHSGVWATCATCHITAGDFSSFSCINCHTHSQSNTDPNHGDVRGYVYSATSCYSCHARGTAD